MAAIHPFQENCFDKSRSEQGSREVRLDQQIMQITQKDAELFHALNTVRNYEHGTDFIKNLTFPERLLDVEKRWKEYDSDNLKPKSPLFKTLHLHISQIEEGLGDPRLKDIVPELQKVQNTYKTYIKNCCENKGKDRRSLLKGPVRLSGYFRGKAICKEIDRKMGRKLVSINRFNENIRSNPFGASVVYKDKEREVFYKRAYRNPIRPGNEFLFHTFNTLFLGGRTTPTKLLKLENISVKDLSLHEKIEHPINEKLEEEWRQKKADKQYNVPYSKFIITHPDCSKFFFKEIRKNYFVQASLGVRGEELNVYLDKHSIHDLEQCVSPYNYGAMALLSLIFRVDDGRGDNYMLEEPKKVLRDCVGIDNDGILPPPVRKTAQNKHIIQLRSILFLLGRRMEDPLDQELKDHLLSLNIERTFISYLKEVETYNEKKLSDVFSSAELSQVDLPLKLSLSNLLSIYRSTKTIQEALIKEKKEEEKSEKAKTHSVASLFKTLYPPVYQTYKKLMEGGESLLNIQNLLFDPRETPYIEDVLNLSSKKVEEMSKDLPGMAIEGKLLSISELLEPFIDAILPDLNAKEQEELINHTHRVFNTFKKTTFKEIKFSNAVLAEMIKTDGMPEIFVEDAHIINPEGLENILHNYPHVKIAIGKNKTFNPNSLANLIKRAQKMQYCLFYYTQDKTQQKKVYPLFTQDLSDLLIPAIKNEDLVLTEALCNHLNADLEQKDKDGNNLLHQAAKEGVPLIMNFFIEGNFFPMTTSNSLGQSLFHLAAEGNSVQALETLLQLEENDKRGLCQKDAHGRTPLQHAAHCLARESTRFLLNEVLAHRLPAGENIHLEKDEEGYTLLHLAAKFGLIEQMNTLMDQHNIPVNALGAYNRTPLHMATHNGQAKATQLLLQRGANINAQPVEDALSTPLHEAVLQGHIGVTEALAQSEYLNVNLQNAGGFSALDIAVGQGKVAITNLLINHSSFQDKEKKLSIYIKRTEDHIKQNKDPKFRELLGFLYQKKGEIILANEHSYNKLKETPDLLSQPLEMDKKGNSPDYLQNLHQFSAVYKEVIDKAQTGQLTMEEILIFQDQVTQFAPLVKSSEQHAYDQLVEKTRAVVVSIIESCPSECPPSKGIGYTCLTFQYDDQNYVVKHTLGDGACALHALLGIENEGVIQFQESEPVAPKRHYTNALEAQLKEKNPVIEEHFVNTLTGYFTGRGDLCGDMLFRDSPEGEELRHQWDQLDGDYTLRIDETKVIEGKLWLPYVSKGSPVLQEIIRYVQAISQRGAEESLWYDKSEGEIMTMVNKQPQLLSSIISSDPNRYLAILKSVDQNQLAPIQEIIGKRVTLNQEMEKDKRELILSPPVIERYVAIANKVAFYFNTSEIRIAAHLFNKRVQVVASKPSGIEPSEFMMNQDVPGDLIVIHHQGAHFSRCVKSEDISKNEPRNSPLIPSSSAQSCQHITDEEISELLENESGAAQLFDKVEKQALLSEAQLERLGSYLESPKATDENITSVAAILGEATKWQSLPQKTLVGLRSCLSRDPKLDRYAIESVEKALNNIEERQEV